MIVVKYSFVFFCKLNQRADWKSCRLIKMYVAFQKIKIARAMICTSNLNLTLYAI